MDHPIPAGSLNGVDFHKLRQRDAETVKEIENLAQLLDSGNDTDADFLRLCQLLLHVGERDKAKELLLANCDEGDDAYELFQAQYPDAEGDFERAVVAFERQFGCELSVTRTARHLSKAFSCIVPQTNSLPEPLRNFSNSEDIEVQITYETSGDVVADVYSLSNSARAVPLSLDSGVWVRGSSITER